MRERSEVFESELALVLFVLVGLTACVVPGLRATRLDPVRALRQE